MKAMRLGGNERLEEFFTQYGISDMDIERKYRTIASKYYRDKLRAKVDCLPFEEVEPEIEVGVLDIDQAPPPPEAPPAESRMTAVSGFFGSLMSKTSELTHSAVSKASGFRNSSAAAYLGQTVNSTVTGLKTGAQNVMESKAVTTIKSTTSNAAKSVSELAGASYTAINESETIKTVTGVASEKFLAIQTGFRRQFTGEQKPEDDNSSNN